MKLPKGYFKVPNWVFGLGLSAYALLILMYFCRRADKNGWLFPSLNRIGKDCSIKSRTTVSKAIEELQSMDLIRKMPSHSPGRSNRYKLSSSIIETVITDKTNKQPGSLNEQPCSSREHKPVQEMNTKEYTEKENIKEGKSRKKEKNKTKQDSPSSSRKDFSKAVELLNRRALGEDVDLSTIYPEYKGGKEDV
ncbi:MAG: hypothetical protein GTO02_23075 [Candidatus Dadabacteria bacterium]|nr:hypothetical protein [Candidatus Dadabacteria bacterium]